MTQSDHVLPALLKIPEVARYCRTTDPTVRHWIYTGQLPSKKVGRHRLIRREDLEAFIEGGE